MQTWLPHFTNGQTIILVHNVCTSADDLALLKLLNFKKQFSAFFCLCPNANLYITGKLPDVKMLIKHGCNIVLGTDSLASNDKLCLLEEMKTLQKNVNGLTLETLLQWATSNGASALQMESQLGSFEKGKQPGVILIGGVDNLQLGKNSFVKRIL